MLVQSAKIHKTWRILKKNRLLHAFATVDEHKRLSYPFFGIVDTSCHVGS